MFTTDQLPEAVKQQYELTEPLQGGPVFGLPHYGESEIDFSKMTLAQADNLVRNGYPGLDRKKGSVVLAEIAAPPPGDDQTKAEGKKAAK